MIHHSKPVKILAIVMLLILTISAISNTLGVPKPVSASTPASGSAHRHPRVTSNSASLGEGLYGQYFDVTCFGTTLNCQTISGIPTNPGIPNATETDPEIDFGQPYFNWHPFGWGSFSVLWTGNISIAIPGTYAFQLYSDDGSWLYVDSNLVVDNGGGHSPAGVRIVPQIKANSVFLGQGVHEIVVGFFECCGGPSGVDLSWEPPGSTSFTLVPSDVFTATPPPVTQGVGVNVRVTNSSGLPVSGASLVAFYENGLIAQKSTSDSDGASLLILYPANYTVTASYPGYATVSQLVDVNQNQSVSLTFSSPYNFLGVIPDSNYNATQVTGGYSIQLKNMFSSSFSNVFFEWRHVGNLALGSGWTTFFSSNLPELVVIAASKGSGDYPNAWYRYPVPYSLNATTGLDGALLPEPIPYAAASIFILPYPPIQNQLTTIGVNLHNPLNHSLNISRIDFQISGLTIGGYFSSVGSISNFSLGANQSASPSIFWNATDSGHHCVRVVLTYPDPPTDQPLPTQVLQRNLDIESNLLPYVPAWVSFTLVNPTAQTADIVIHSDETLPPGWSTSLYVNGARYDPTVDNTIYNVAAHASIPVVLYVTTNSIGSANIYIEGYIGDQLIGGIHKIMNTILSGPTVVATGIGGASMTFKDWSVEISGSGWTVGASVSFRFKDPSFTTYLSGSATVDKYGKFDTTINFPRPGGAVTPIPGKLQAFSDTQAAETPFLYLGDFNLEQPAFDCWASSLLVPYDEAGYVYTWGSITWNLYTQGAGYFQPKGDFVGDSVGLIADYLDALRDAVKMNPRGPFVSCAMDVINFLGSACVDLQGNPIVSCNVGSHDLDVLVETLNGTIGTYGSGTFINSLGNDSWASGNNFNDTQGFVLPPFKTYRLVIDASRATQQTEFYNLSLGFGSVPDNMSLVGGVSGQIQKGQSITYVVSLSSGKVSIVKASPALIPPAISVSPTTVGKGQSAKLSTTKSFTGGKSPYSCQWLKKSPKGTTFTALGTPFTTGCTLSSKPTVSTGALTTTGTWSFELRVKDGMGAVVISSSAKLLVSSFIVTCSHASVTVGSTTTCKATVYGPLPTGSVAWSSSKPGKFSSTSCQLTSSACSVMYTPASSSSPVTITAHYLGDRHNAASSKTFSLTVKKAPTTTTLSCTKSSFTRGASITCTAKVTGRYSSHTGTITWTKVSGKGSVTFSKKTCTLIAGRCSVTVKATVRGSITIKATYSGDTHNLGSSGTKVLTIA